MFVEYVFMILGFCVLSTRCHHRKQTGCEGSLCYHLYEIDTKYLTWIKAVDACSNEGLQLARIESNKTQMLIEGFVQDLPINTLRQIWIGGRRGTDDKWRYMNGTEFNKQILVASPNEAARYCSYVKLCKGIAPEYHDDNCDEKTGPSRILCQYDDSKINSCTSPDSHFGDKCYRKTTYDGQEPNKIDWFNGETYCSQSDIQGDIAYSYLDDDTLINDIINFVDDSKDCILLWLGVRKRIWFWMTGSNIDGDKQPIHYFNWDNNINIDSSEDGCIYIDRYNGNKWFTQNCDDPSLRYFICMNGSSLTTTKAPATAISKSTTETKTSTTIKTTTKASATVTSRSTTDRMISKTNKTTTARTHLDKTITTTVKGSDSLMDKDNKNSFKTVYIAAIIVLIALVIIIGLAVFCVMKKRKKSNRGQR